MNLSESFQKRGNHLNLIRFFLSVLVIFSHSYSLGNFGTEKFLGFGNDKYGNLAVNAFFVLSGFLITGSFVRNRNAKKYFLNRVLRIFPGFWVALLMIAFVLGPLVYFLKTGNLSGYRNTEVNSPAGYFFHNFLLKMNQYEIGTLFRTNPYPGMVNGALWTLIYEFVCYMLVMLAGMAGLLKKHPVWIVLLLILMAVNSLVYSPFSAGMPSSLLSALHFFVYYTAGVAACLFAENITLANRNLLISAGLFLTFALVPGPVVTALYHFLCPVLLVSLLFSAAFYGPESRLEAKLPDVSYGLYIYGWFIQQALVYLNVLSDNFTVYFVSATAFTLLLALFSYYAVERPAMTLKSKIRW